VKTGLLVGCVAADMIYLQLENGIDGLGAIVIDVCIYALCITRYT